MKKKDSSYRILRRKIIGSLLMVAALTAVIAWNFMKKAYAYQYVESPESKTYPDGYCDVVIKGPQGEERVNVTFAYSGEQMTQNKFNDEARKIRVKRKAKEEAGVYKAKVPEKDIWTKANDTGTYTRIEFEIQYWQPAHEEYASVSYTKVKQMDNITNARSNFKDQSGHSSSGRWVTVKVNISMYTTGICTIYSGNKNYRIWNTEVNCALKKNDYTVTYKGNNEAADPEPGKFGCGSRITFPEIARSGYTFDGWKDASGKAYTTDNRICGSDLTLYAQWKANQYKIHYDANGGEGSMEDDTVTYNTSFTFPRSGFTKSGYSFLGWSRTKGSNVADYDDQEEITYKIASDLTLYAVYGNGQYKVSFEPNGAEGDQTVMAVKSGESTALAKNPYQRKDYTFLGWSTDPDASSATYTDGQQVSDLAEAGKTKRLYAVWKRNDGSFTTNNIIHDEKMFTGDIEIEGQNGTTYDDAHTDSGYARIDQSGASGYFTDRYKK